MKIKILIVLMLTLVISITSLSGCRRDSGSSESAESVTSADSISISNEPSVNSSEDSSSSSSSIPSESEGIDFLSMPLYGDTNFVKKMRDSKERTTLNDLTENTVYVSLSGNDGTATGKIDSPYSSINKAIQKANDNISIGKEGIVCVRAGRYAQNVSFDGCSGKESSYLMLVAYPGEEVKIAGTSSEENVDFSDSNYIIMEGFIICDNIVTVDPVAIRMDSANGHIILKYNTITNIKTDTSKKGEPCGFLIYMNGTLTAKSHNNVLFYKNYLYDNQTGWSEAIEVVGNCENINIIENIVTDCGNIGIDVGGNFGYCKDKALDQARFVYVRGNDVSECNSYYATSYAIYVDGARDVIIENNKAYNSQGGIEIGSEVKVAGYEVKNIVVRNNLVYDNVENGITVGGYDESVGTVLNTKIYNNTVVNNCKSGEYDWNGQLTVSMVDGLEVYNNIFYSDKEWYALVGGDIKESNCKNVVFKNNIYYNSANPDADDAYFVLYDSEFYGFSEWCSKTGENGKYQDPLFFNISSHDFRLNSSSPAINFGNNTIESGDYDHALNSRKNGIVDCGCYEFYA